MKSIVVFRALSCCGLLTVLLLCDGGFTADLDSPESVQTEFVQALASLESKFAVCSGEGLYSSSRTPNGNGVVVARRWVSFAFSAGQGRVTKTNIATSESNFESIDLSIAKKNLQPETEVVIGYNRNYSFSVKDTSAGYTVQSLQPGENPGKQAIARQWGRIVHPTTTGDNVPLLQFMSLKDVRINKITRIGSSPEPVLKLEFSRPFKPNEKKATIHVTSGWLVASPAEQWLIREYGIEHTYNDGRFRTTSVGHVSYQPGPDKQLRPNKIDFRSYVGAFTTDPAVTDPAIIPIESQDFRFADFRFGDSPARDFTLTAFGLPEFGQTVTQAAAARSFPWWTVGAAVGFGVLALVLRRLARRGPPSPGPVAA